MSKDGALFEWSYMQNPKALENGESGEDVDDERWRISNRHYFLQNNAHMNCATYHAASNILVTGFSNGVFMIHELPDFVFIQNLRFASRSRIAGTRLTFPQYLTKQHRLCVYQ